MQPPKTSLLLRITETMIVLGVLLVATIILLALTYLAVRIAGDIHHAWD